MGEVRGRAEASGAICVNKPGVCKAGIIWSRFLGFCPAGVWGGVFLIIISLQTIKVKLLFLAGFGCLRFI